MMSNAVCFALFLVSPSAAALLTVSPSAAALLTPTARSMPPAVMVVKPTTTREVAVRELKGAARPFKFVLDRLSRPWRTAAAIKDAVVTADLMRVDSQHRVVRDLAENDWEETVLPQMAVAAASRDLAEVSWEDRLLPPMASSVAARRDLAENSWEDRFLPGPAPRLGCSRRDLAGWEENLLPSSATTEAARDLSECDWEERFLP